MTAGRGRGAGGGGALRRGRLGGTGASRTSGSNTCASRPTLVALIATAVAVTPAHDAGARRDWFVAALGVLTGRRRLAHAPAPTVFVAGLAAFLVGHLCYVAGFWTQPPGGVALAIAAGVVVVVVVPVAGRILGALRGRRELGVPVALYMVVISVMLATALATGNVLAGVGAAVVRVVGRHDRVEPLRPAVPGRRRRDHGDLSPRPGRAGALAPALTHRPTPGIDARAPTREMGQAVAMTPAPDPTSTAHIAFICAMPMELEPLSRKLELEESTLGDLTAHTATIGDPARGGHRHRDGHRAGHRRHHRVCSTPLTVERVVVVGITGAVENETPIGTLILPEVVVNGATGDEFRPAPLGEGTPAGRMWTSDDLQQRPGPHRRPTGPRRGVSRHGDGGNRRVVRRTGHPVVGVPGHQRPRH